MTEKYQEATKWWKELKDESKFINAFEHLNTPPNKMHKLTDIEIGIIYDKHKSRNFNLFLGFCAIIVMIAIMILF